MPFKPTTSHEPPTPEFVQAEVVDPNEAPRSHGHARQGETLHEPAAPILPLIADFLGRAAVGVSRLDPERGAKIAVAAVTARAISDDADHLVATGKQLHQSAQAAAAKYVPMVKKALTPGLENRALVDMHRSNYERGRR